MTPEGSLLVAERVARAVIPDLEGVPLYLLQPGPTSLLTRHQTNCSFGNYFPNLDLAFQSELERTGRWKGRGVAVVADASLCFSFARDDCAGLRKAVGVVLHELCHWLDLPQKPASETPYDDWLKADKPEQFAAKHPEFPPFLIGHDDTFVRLCCHVWYRGRLRGGEPLRPKYLSFASDYPGLEWMPSPGECIAALEDELELFDELPLRKVAALREPEAYTELWRAAYARMPAPVLAVA